MVDILDDASDAANGCLDETKIKDALLSFSTDTDAIKSYTGKLMSFIFTHELKKVNDIIDEFRNLIRNKFLEDSDETYEYRDGIVEYITQLEREIKELKQFEDKYKFDETFVRDYEKIFIEDFVIASNILNLDLGALFQDENDRLLIKCTCIIAHKLFKHDECMNKIKKMNYHNCFEKKTGLPEMVALDSEGDGA